MSAFIVAESCMAKVVRAVVLCMAQTHRTFAGQAISEHGPIADEDKAGTVIGRELYAMNRAAIVERYGESGVADMGGIPDFTYESPTRRELKRGEAVAAFKACQALAYQCAEGEIDKTELFQELDSVITWLARGIVSELPEYESAAWGD